MADVLDYSVELATIREDITRVLAQGQGDRGGIDTGSNEAQPGLQWSWVPADIPEHYSDLAKKKRKRSTRACDGCRRSKAGCNGQSPCKRCIGLGLHCEYLYIPKRRGRASRQQRKPDGVESNEPVEIGPISNASHSTASSPHQHTPGEENPSSNSPPSPKTRNQDPDIALPDFSTFFQDQSTSMNALDNSNWGINSYNSTDTPSGAGIYATPQWTEQNLNNPHFLGFGPLDISPWTDIMTAPASPLPAGPDINSIRTSIPEKSNRDTNAFLPSPQNQDSQSLSFLNGLSTSPQSNFGPSSGLTPLIAEVESVESVVRYPVLLPLLPELSTIITPEGACQLLDYYFMDASDTNPLVKPHSPYVLVPIFRKKSFLHSKTPRPTSPALLCSLLFVAVQTSNLADLKVTPSSKATISRQLFDLCLRLLGPFDISGEESTVDDNDENDRYVSPRQNLDGKPKADFDTLITYVNLQTIVSAGDFKGESKRWWKAACQLAIDLDLNHELKDEDLTGLSIPRIEEYKEERRRTWWLLFMCDRHIALSYNSRLFLRQESGDELYLPLDDKIWQGDDFAFSSNLPRRLGPCHKMTSISNFGFFLPLMRILGDCLILHHQRNAGTIDIATEERTVERVTTYLREYEQSIRNISAFLDARDLSDHRNPITRIALCYSNHIVHVMYILLYGKWDPILMLDDVDGWMSSPRFITAAQHAVAAAETISQILILDPELNYMPYLWGIYLLQGSFILLCFTEMLESGCEASRKMIVACETVVRAHEVCVATLNTEYQRNFRRVLRWALQKITGTPFDQTRRSVNMRESLLLYRWCRGGKGLAL